MNIQDCIKKGHVKIIKPDRAIIGKEFKEARYDLEKAKKAGKEQDYKWSIIKCYYAMFHAARAILLQQGYQEKKHFAISIVLEELNKKALLESRYLNDFNAAMSSRQDADYHAIYSKEVAEHTLKIGEEFLRRMLHLQKTLKVIKL